MSLQCRLVDIKEVRAKGETVKPGDMWYYGKTLVIKLPCGDDWAPVHPDGAGWDITGEPPIITASPSIMCEHYHGWLRDGVFSDDTDGRTY
jgi:hypothetical protein